MDLHIVLHEPEIPQNTGSIGRTCMALGAHLHLVEPLGFSMDNRYLKRAGLDYWKTLSPSIHRNWEGFLQSYPDAPLWFFTTKAPQSYERAAFGEQAFLVFGKETAGLPETLLKENPNRCLRIPLKERARSLNLSVAVGAAALEALRQNEFKGLEGFDPEQRLFCKEDAG